MCRTTQCDFPGLEERKSYSFRVAAINKAGQSAFSDASQTAYADTKPGRVSNIRMVARGDHTLTLAWTKPASTTAIENYRISFQGQPAVEIAGTSPTYVVTGLDNNVKYFFSITAENSVGYGQARESPPFQSIGTPAPPGNLTVVDRQSGAQQTSVTATWTGTAPEGPAPTLYTLYYSVEGGPVTTVPGCSRIQSTTCTHTGVPYEGDTYSYVVRAHNVEKTSNPSTPFAFEAIGKPAEWGAITVTPDRRGQRGPRHRHRPGVARQPVARGDPGRRRCGLGGSGPGGRHHQRARQDTGQLHVVPRPDAHVQREGRHGRLQLLRSEGRADLRPADEPPQPGDRADRRSQRHLDDQWYVER